MMMMYMTHKHLHVSFECGHTVAHIYTHNTRTVILTYIGNVVTGLRSSSAKSTITNTKTRVIGR